MVIHGSKLVVMSCGKFDVVEDNEDDDEELEPDAAVLLENLGL